MWPCGLGCGMEPSEAISEQREGGQAIAFTTITPQQTPFGSCLPATCALTQPNRVSGAWRGTMPQRVARHVPRAARGVEPRIQFGTLSQPTVEQVPSVNFQHLPQFLSGWAVGKNACTTLATSPWLKGLSYHISLEWAL